MKREVFVDGHPPTVGEDYDLVVHCRWGRPHDEVKFEIDRE